MFWSLGNRQLMMAATKRHHDEMIKCSEEQNATFRSKDDLSSIKNTDQDERGCAALEGAGNTVTGTDDANHDEPSNNQKADLSETLQVDNTAAINPAVALSSDKHVHSIGILESIWIACKQTVTSAGFIAMVAAFITACIPPLQRALFESGGPLRFLGSAVETLGIASSPISTMVVAASLVPPRQQEPEETSNPVNLTDIQETGIDENPAMSDPNFGPYRRRPRQSSRIYNIRRSLRSGSMRILQAMPRSKPEMIRLHVWFCISTLVLTPAVNVGLLLALDCSGNLLSGVPSLAKLVIIINASLPGALIVIVLLKSREDMSETAAAVAKVYLPSYLLSIVTIAAWTAVGLWVTIPDDNGRTVCQR